MAGEDFRLDNYIDTAPLETAGIDPDWLTAIVGVESNFNPNAVNPETGAAGFGQLMEGTAKALKVEDRFDPQQNLRGASDLLIEEWKRYNGDPVLALSAYNMGSPLLDERIKRAGSTDFGTLSALKDFPQGTTDYVPKVVDAYLRIKAEKNQKAPNPEEGTSEDFHSELTEVMTRDTFNTMPTTQRVEEINQIYNSRQSWVPEVDEQMKSVTAEIWDAAYPEEKIAWGSIFGPAVSGNTIEEVEASAAESKETAKEALRAQGVNPNLYGEEIDNYFDAIELDEIERITARDMGVVGAIGEGFRETGAGLTELFTSSIAGGLNVAGFEESAQAVEELPTDIFGQPSRQMHFQLDSEGNIMFDEDGQPITRWQGTVLRGLGQGLSTLGTGAALYRMGATVAAPVFFGSTAVLSTANEAYTAIRDVGGTRNEALLGTVYSLPAAGAEMLGDMVSLGSGKPWIKGLKGYAKARAVTQTAGKIVGRGGAEVVGEVANTLGTQAAASIATDLDLYDSEEVAQAAIGSIAPGFLFGGYSTGVEIRNRKQRLLQLREQRVRTQEARAQRDAAPEVGQPVGLPEPQGEPIPLGNVPDAKTQENLATRFQDFAEGSENTLVVDLPENQELPKGLAELFAFDAQRISPDQIVLTKQTTHENAPTDTNSLDAINERIIQLEADLKDTPSPYSEGDLVREKTKLAKKKGELEKRIPSEDLDDNNSLRDLRKDLSKKREANRKERAATKDKTLQSLLDEEFQTLQQQIKEVEESTTKAKEVKALNKVNDEIAKIDNALSQIENPIVRNNVQPKKAELESLYDKREGLLRQENPDADTDRRAVSLRYETDKGTRFVVPYKDFWYVTDSAGKAITAGHRFVPEAIKAATQTEAAITPEVKIFPAQETKRPKKTKTSEKATPDNKVSEGVGDSMVFGESTTLAESAEVASTQVNADPRLQIKTRKTPSAKKSKKTAKYVTDLPDPNIPPTEDFIVVTPAKAADGERVGLTSIKDKLLKFGRSLTSTPVSAVWGVATGRGNLGYFNFFDNFIRIRNNNDFLTLLHEKVHILDKMFIGKWDRTGLANYQGIPPEVLEGLRQTARTWYKGKISGDLEVAEGFTKFAENLARGWPVHKDVLEWFNTEFAKESPEQYQLLMDAITEIQKYVSLLPNERVRDFRSAEPEKGLRKVWRSLVDVLNPTELRKDWEDKTILLKKAGQRLKLNEVTDATPHNIWSALNIDPYDVANYLANVEVIDIFQNKYEGLVPAQILAPVEDAGALEIFKDYVTAKRFLHAYNEQNIPSGLSDADLIGTIELVEQQYPDVAKAAEAYWSWWDRAQYARTRGSVATEALYEKQKALNMKNTGAAHGYYIPVKREGQEGAPEGKIVGSFRRTEDFILHAGTVLVNQIRKNNQQIAMSRILETVANNPYEDPYLSKMVRTLKDPDLKKRIDDYINEKTKKFEEDNDLNLLSPEESKSARDYFRYALGIFDAPEGILESKDYRIVIVPTENDFKVFEVNKDFIDSFDTSVTDVFENNPIAAKVFDWTVQKPKRTLQTTATTLSLPFQVGNALMRDIGPYFRRQPSADDAPLFLKPVVMGFDWFHGMQQSFSHALGLKQYSRWANTIERMGRYNSARMNHEVYQQKLESSGRKVAELTGQTAGQVITFLSAAEQGPRVAAFIRTLKNLGYTDPDEVISFEALVMSLANYSKNTTDYRARGKKAEQGNKVYPFFTARIANLAQTLTDFKQRPGRTIPLFLSYNALGYALYGMFKDEEWFKELNFIEKMDSFLWPVDVEGDKRLIRYRLDSLQSMGLGFGMMMAESLDQNEETPSEELEWASAIMKMFLPVSMGGLNAREAVETSTAVGGPVFQHAMEQLSNRKFYFDREIVPRGMEHLDLKDQWTPNTSEVAKFLGQELGWSPLRIDAAFQTFLSGPLGAAKMVGQLLDEEPDPRGKSFEDPFLNMFFHYELATAVYSKSEERFYEAKAEALAKKDAETVGENRVRTELDKAGRYLSNLRVLINKNRNLKPEERDQLVAVRKLIINQGIEIAEGKRRKLSEMPRIGEAGKRLKEKLKVERRMKAIEARRQEDAEE